MDLLNYSADNFENFFDQIFDDKIAKSDIKDFLVRLNDANMPQNAFIGAISSLKKRMTTINAPQGAIDVCGTGGDKLNTLNVSTAVSFVVAGAGVTVAKHGNKAISSKSGSADIFNELGIKISDSKEEIEKTLKAKKLCFLFAPIFHQSLKHVVEARKELAVATIFNFLGPLLNPANTRYQLIGTSNKDSMSKIAAAISHKQQQYKEDCVTYIVHGCDGMDEITITDNSYLIRCENGKIFDEEIINPEELGLTKVALKDIAGQEPKYNARKLVRLLEGEISPYRDIVVLNASYALLAAQKTNDIKKAIKLAKDSIDSKKALKILTSLT